MTAKNNDQTAGTSLPPKEAPASLELRAKPRPVTRLNPRMLAVVVGGLSAAVLGAMLWSLQPQQRRQGTEQSELYNVDRVARSEGLEQLPADYSQLPPPPAPEIPQLGPPLPGDLGGPILRAGQQAQGYGHGPDAAKQSAWPCSRKPRRQRSPRCSSRPAARGNRTLHPPGVPNPMP